MGSYITLGAVFKKGEKIGGLYMGRSGLGWGVIFCGEKCDFLIHLLCISNRLPRLKCQAANGSTF